MNLVENIKELNNQIQKIKNKKDETLFMLENDFVYIEKYQNELFDLICYMTKNNLTSFCLKKQNIDIFCRIGAGNVRSKFPLNIMYSTINCTINISVEENMLKREKDSEEIFKYTAVKGFELKEEFKRQLTENEINEERKILLNCFKETMNNIDELKQTATKEMNDFLSNELYLFNNNNDDKKNNIEILESFILKVEEYKKERNIL